MPQVNKRAILETLERPTLERLAALSMERREDYNLEVYGHGLDHDPELDQWLDLSAPHADDELVGFIMKNRLIGAYDVIMALHAPELRRTCKVLGVLDRPAPKAELRLWLNDAVGRSVDRPMPPDQPDPHFDEATQDWIWPEWDARRLRWVWPAHSVGGHSVGALDAATPTEPRG